MFSVLEISKSYKTWRNQFLHTNIIWLVYTQKYYFNSTPQLLFWLIYIYIYAFSRRFYPKRLTIAFRLYIFSSMCVPWESNPQPFCATDAMLYHWATQEHS